MTKEKILWDSLHKPVDLSKIGQRIFTIENYFDNVDDVRKHSLTKTFSLATKYGPSYKGYKSPKLSTDIEIENNIISKLKTTLKSELSGVNVDMYRLEVYFQYMLESTKDTFEPSFEENPLHRDAGYQEYAGIVYLNPTVDTRYGTDVNGEFVENIYNRFVCYPAHAWHGPSDMFGDSLENARMTIVFFLYQNLTERPPMPGPLDSSQTRTD